jgi:prephenate dehydrogenase
MEFKRLSILGVGLLGGSIGLAVKKIASGGETVGYGHRTSTLESAIRLGAIDRSTTSAAEAVGGADLVVLCTPVGTFRSLLQEIAKSLRPGAIVTDVGSTKRSVVRFAEELLPGSVHFVGSHPMAGSEKRGVEFAKADLFNGALCIVTPTARTNPGALAKVENFWAELGMRTKRLSPDDHDRLICDVSHLPHAVAASLVAMQSDEALELAGKGFQDTTRVAAGDAGLWRDILKDNADSVRSSIARLRIQLDELEKRLDPKQAQALFDWLQAAADKRSRQ